MKSSVAARVQVRVSQTVPERAGQGGEERLLNHDVTMVRAQWMMAVSHCRLDPNSTR